MPQPPAQPERHQILWFARKHRLGIIVAVVVVLVSAGGAYGYHWYQAKNAASTARQTSKTVAGPGPDAKATPKPNANGTAELKDDAQLVDAVGASPTPLVTAAPGEPSVEIVIDTMHNLGNIILYSDAGKSTRDVSLTLVTQNIDAPDCSTTDEVILDDAAFTRQSLRYSGVASQTISMADGLHTLVAHCQNDTVTSRSQVFRIADRQPKACKGFAFSGGDVTASTLQELRAGLVGTWKGCVTTPWGPPYAVTMTFNADGTYQATSDETMDGTAMVAMYYGTDDPSPYKVYGIDTFQGSLGYGYVDVFFGDDNINRDPLNHVRLMGDKLSFDFMHHNEYGPLTYQLIRQ